MQPNVLYLHSHDTGRWIQPYGFPVPTPNLMHLAREGTLFRNCHCAMPTCSASRSALLTGMMPHNNGMMGLAHRGFRLSDYRQHLVHTLKAAGYATAMGGVQHVHHWRNRLGEGPGDPPGIAIGYDRDLNAERGDFMPTEAAVGFIREPHDHPWFLAAGYFETHREFPELDAEDLAAANPDHGWVPPGLPDSPEVRRDVARFVKMARQLDANYGRILAALEDTGQADTTLVICTTDHGPAFPGYKCNLTDGGTGVLLLLRGPGVPVDAVRDAMVSHLDIFPTLCDLLGIVPPQWLQGLSLRPLLDGPDRELREDLFTEVTYHASYEPMRALRTPRWKFIRRFHDFPTPVLANCDAGLSKDVLLGHGWRGRPQPREELYDLVYDPQEACNLVADPAAARALADCRAQLTRWMERTGDPLLAGPVPAPPGAIVNAQEHLHPTGDGRDPEGRPGV